MNEENNLSYYSIIPATVRYDTRLKSAEKILYSEITALTNSMGYCFATNKYFANLYKVTTHTISQWISHLSKLGYIYLEFIRGPNNDIKERRIYIQDIPYVQKNTYPYVLKSTYPMYKKVQDNIIDIDDLYNLIINKDKKLPTDFTSLIEKLELNYSADMILNMQDNVISMLKVIYYTLFDIYNGDFSYILDLIDRNQLIILFKSVKEHNPIEIFSYFKKSIINYYSNL